MHHTTSDRSCELGCGPNIAAHHVNRSVPCRERKAGGHRQDRTDRAACTILGSTWWIDTSKAHAALSLRTLRIGNRRTCSPVARSMVLTAIALGLASCSKEDGYTDLQRACIAQR